MSDAVPSDLRRPAISRLKKRADFLKVQAANCKFVTPGLIMQARPHSSDYSLPDIRLGFTVSKKVGNAVMRNRARRRLRAAAADILPLKAAQGYDLVLIGRAGTLNRTYPDLCRDINQALHRLGVAP